MLRDGTLHPSLAASDLTLARRWYEERLGWVPSEELDGLIRYDVGSSAFTIYESGYAGTAKNTVAALEVNDFEREAVRLRGRGLVFDVFDWPGRSFVDGVYTSADGSHRAWFTDSEGNAWLMADDPGRRGPRVSAMLAASDIPRARAWYAEKLGCEPTDENEDELGYEYERYAFGIYATPNAGTAKNTVAVWRVADLPAEVAWLRGRGVTFEEYDFGEDGRTVDGILSDADGPVNAWFKDSEGNILALAQVR